MLQKTELYSRELKTSFSTDFEIFRSKNRIAIFTEWRQLERLRMMDRRPTEHIRRRLSGGLKMGALTLQALASISDTDFQKIIDAEGKISGFQWFKNSGLFYGLQDEIRNVLNTQEAL